MNRMFLSELHEEQLIGLCMSNGIEREYTILNLYTDGLRVKYDHSVIKNGENVIQSDIVLIPFTSIKYIRMIKDGI